MRASVAHFALLVLAQLEQQRHRRRLQLLDFFGIGIDQSVGSDLRDA